MSLHVETLGRGPDLVMLHGWALHSGIWAGMREPLSRHFRLHLLDLPGHGQSVAGDSQTFDAWVSEIAAMLPEEQPSAAGPWADRSRWSSPSGSRDGWSG